MKELSSAWLDRFSGIGRLYGTRALHALADAHFMIIGIGGVGTWAAEALARTGVGELTLIDMDDVCITNTNRQMHALQTNIGRSKIEATAERLKLINPEIKVNLIEDFISTDNIPTIVTPDYDMVIDSMDMAHTKSGLIAYCMARKIGIVTVGSAGGKQDPTAVTWGDLARTEYDPMLSKIRRDLYKNHNLSKDKNRKFRVDAIYSTEAMVYPKPDGQVCTQKQALQDGVRLDCTGGFGSATMVTGTFGFTAASRAITRYLMKWERLNTAPSESQL